MVNGKIGQENIFSLKILGRISMEDFMEGVDLPVSPQEMREAWDYFWRRNQLGINSRGRVYRTTIPRKMPDNKVQDFIYGRGSKKKMYS